MSSSSQQKPQPPGTTSSQISAMVRRGSQQASAPATADPRLDSTAALLPPGPPPRGTSARRGRGGCRAGAAAADTVEVRRSAVAPCVSCRIRDGSVISECFHAFCRRCMHEKLTTEDNKCPTCGFLLGPAPSENLGSVSFHAKRPNVNAVTTKNKKRKEKVSTSTISSVVDIIIGGRTTKRKQEIEVEVINNEADEALVAQESVYESSILNHAPVGRDALSRIRCRDFYSACHLNAETGALILWQPAPIPEQMVAHEQLAPRQDPQTFQPPATSDTEYQRQAPDVQMTNNTPVVAGSSFHARMTVQDDDNLRGDILAMFNESTARIMGRYDDHISQLKTENSKLIEQLENERADALERTRMLEGRHQQELENERAAAAERTRMLEERHQRELENERAAAAERTRTLQERLQKESEIARSATNRSLSLEAQNARLYEGLENGRADNQALMSDIAEKSDELAALKYHSDMLQSDKKDLEKQVENLKKELEYTIREHGRYARQVLDGASRAPMLLTGADPCTLLHESTGPRSNF